MLATTSGPLLLVDDEGWVAHYSGVLVRDRIAAPRSDRPLHVPGLGLCLPERLGEGWLVRPDRRGATLRAHLATSGAEAVLEVTGSDGDGWRAQLSPRHATILRLIAGAGAEGLTAAALSRLLFGDERDSYADALRVHEHQVTVRAEMSRLRRAIGALVATGPYRIADGVDFTCPPVQEGESVAP